MKRDNITENVIYEDDIAVAIMENEPAAEGHIVVMPKKHVLTLDQMSEEESEHLWFVASYAATMLFETLGSHGTNLISHEGDEVYIDIIARSQDDGLDFQWKPKQIPTRDMDAVKSSISSSIVIGAESEPMHPPRMDDKPETINADKPVTKDGKMTPEDYFLKKLQRIP